MFSECVHVCVLFIKRRVVCAMWNARFYLETINSESAEPTKVAIELSI